MHLALAALLACAPAVAQAPLCEPDHKIQFKPTKYPKGMVPFHGDVDDQTMAPVNKKLKELVDDGAKTLLIRIDSPGGDLETMWSTVQLWEGYQARGVKIQCVVDTFAASAAFDLLQTCDERLITPRGTALTHQLSTTVSGTRQNLEDRMRLVEQRDLARLEREAKRMGIPLAELLEKTAGHDWSMSADEALAVNAVDATVDPKTLPPPYELEKPEEKPGVLNFLFK